jgi:hypothetical protein
MSVTLKELRDIIKNTPGIGDSDEALDRAIAAVLDRLADEWPNAVCKKPLVGAIWLADDWLRSIAHPPAPKPVPDVEAAKAALAALDGLACRVRDFESWDLAAKIRLARSAALAALEGKR